jgi:acid phosphatase class B
MRSILFLILILPVIGFSQTHTQEEKVLEDWLPSSFGEYKLDGSALSVTSKSDQPYSMSSKVYKKGSSTLTVVIFDYMRNPELLKKYTSAWPTESYENETEQAEIVKQGDVVTFLTYTRADKVSQLYAKIKDRYLLYISLNENAPQFLKRVEDELKPLQLP